MPNEHDDDLAPIVDVRNDMETDDYPKTSEDFEAQELDEDEDAIAGIVGGFAELLDLAFRHGIVVALRVEGQSESEENESEREPTEH